MTGHQHPEDATTPPLDLAAISARLTARTPAEHAARQSRHDTHDIGLAAMRLGEEYLVRGDLDAAHGWFSLAAERHALDAATMLSRTSALREAADSPELIRAATNTPLANQYAPREEQAATQGRLETAADLVLDAHNTATRVVADARTTAEGILAVAREAAQETYNAALDETKRILANAHSIVANTPVHAETTAHEASRREAGSVRLAERSEAGRPSSRNDSVTRTPENGTQEREPAPRPDDIAADVVAAMRGDKNAIASLLHIVRPIAIRYCRARIGKQESSYALSDDTAQEICLAVLKSLPSYREQGRPFLAFVYGIAAHKVADAHRASAHNRSEPVADVPETDAGPEQQLLPGELSREMVELLKAMPDKHREILLLRIVVGLSAEETAIAVGSTPGAVRVAQHRALTKLRKTMSPDQMK